MKWNIPPKIKIYEALGCLADGRLESVDNEIRVYSSSRNKYYTILYDKVNNAIMANDNGSFFVGYLGYPSIAYLMKINELPFNVEFVQGLKDIPWKDINVKNNNDFEKTIIEIDKILVERGIDLEKFHSFIDQVLNEIKNKSFSLLGTKQKPPAGY